MHFDLHVGRPQPARHLGPEARRAEDIRGPFRTISTTVPGLSISEHFPLLAQQAHRLSIVRSMCHDDPAHLFNRSPRVNRSSCPDAVFRCGGPIAARLAAPGRDRLEASPTPGEIPSAVQHALDRHASGRARRQSTGQDAGWLGKSFDPFHVDGDPNEAAFQVPGLDLPAGISTGRLADRRTLLQRLADIARSAEVSPQSWDRHQQRALDALVSSQHRTPFRSSVRIRSFATATAATSTASACCSPAA